MNNKNTAKKLLMLADKLATKKKMSPASKKVQTIVKSDKPEETKICQILNYLRFVRDWQMREKRKEIQEVINMIKNSIKDEDNRKQLREDALIIIKGL